MNFLRVFRLFYWMPFVVLVLFLTVRVPECAVTDRPTREAGGEPVDAMLDRLYGGKLVLSEYRGRPVLIDFWATWCAPCVGQVPVLNAFHKKYGKRMPLLAIATDHQGAEVVEPFVEEYAVRYLVLLGDNDLARNWGLLGYPTMFLLDPEGRIVEQHTGPVSPAWLERRAALWLGEE